MPAHSTAVVSAAATCIHKEVEELRRTGKKRKLASFFAMPWHNNGMASVARKPNSLIKQDHLLIFNLCLNFK